MSATTRLGALKSKKEKLENHIHCESKYAARNEALIDKLKKQKLQIKEEIFKIENNRNEALA